MPKWTDYTIKTNPADKDEMMILDTAGKANKRLGLSALSDWIIGKIANKVFENLQTQNKTILGAINELNSNRLKSAEGIVSASDLAEDLFIKCDNGEIRLFAVQSTVSIAQGSPDGRGGFLLAYQSTTGSRYGIVILFSYSETIYMKVKDVTWGKWKKIQLS